MQNKTSYITDEGTGEVEIPPGQITIQLEVLFKSIETLRQSQIHITEKVSPIMCDDGGMPQKSNEEKENVVLSQMAIELKKAIRLIEETSYNISLTVDRIQL